MTKEMNERKKAVKEWYEKNKVILHGAGSVIVGGIAVGYLVKTFSDLRKGELEYKANLAKIVNAVQEAIDTDKNYDPICIDLASWTKVFNEENSTLPEEVKNILSPFNMVSDEKYATAKLDKLYGTFTGCDETLENTLRRLNERLLTVQANNGWDKVKFDWILNAYKNE